jgi:hypothetical protein
VPLCSSRNKDCFANYHNAAILERTQEEVNQKKAVLAAETKKKARGEERSSKGKRRNVWSITPSAAKE